MTTRVPAADTEKVLKKKEKQLMKVRDEILERGDVISKISTTLKQKREGEKSMRVSTSRLYAHHTTMQVDGTKRPSDRFNDIRAYSKMDLDVWKYHEVRDWFNKNAAPPEPYKFQPTETGYTLRVDN